MIKRTQALIMLMSMGVVPLLEAIIPYNIFQPYDVLLMPYRSPIDHVRIMVGYEGAVHTRAFLGDDTDMLTRTQTTVNVLQIWQKHQDAIAAFKGSAPETAIGQLAQQLNIDDDNTQHGIYTPCAKLHMPANILFGMQWRLPHHIKLAVFIPYRVAELTNVSWKQHNPQVTYEEIVTPDLIAEIEQVSDMCLRGWKRHGFGDLMIQADYTLYIPQNKPWLKNVGLDVRGGLLFPTGLKENPNLLLGLPFGYDAGVGILAAARLELCYIHEILFGVDVELLHLFGNTRMRRIKINPAQTDLLFLTKVPAFKDPGFTQHYTLYLEKLALYKNLSIQLAYQYTKHNDDKLFVCQEGYSPAIINSAESLQDWTAHNLIGKISYEWLDAKGYVNPSFSLFVKTGFNGKRAILADTVGALFTMNF